MVHKVETETVIIVNKRGLHARPAAKLTKLATSFDCSIKISHNGNTACAKDILDLLTLAASQGSDIKIETFGGKDAKKALESITHLIKTGFEEDQSICPINSKSS